MRRRLVLVLLIAVGFYLASELYFFTRFRAEFGAYGFGIAHLAKGRYQDSPYMVYEPIRNTVNLRAKWRQNNFGFRDERDVGKKADGEFRIFVLGGSAAIGLGSMKEFERLTGVGEYPTRLTLTSHLEEELDRAYPGKTVTVYNAAVSGHRVSHEYSLYMSTIRSLEPDLVVLVDGYNELAVLSQVPPIYVYELDRRSVPENGRLDALARQMMSRSFTAFMLGREYWMSRHREDPDFFRTWLERTPNLSRSLREEAFQESRATIDIQLEDLLSRYAIFKATCDSDGVDLLVCPQPLLPLKPEKDPVETACFNYLMSLLGTPMDRASYFDVYPYFVDALESWASSAAVPFLDLQESVNETGEGVFIDYCHFSYLGNELIGKAIAAKVISLRLIES